MKALPRTAWLFKRDGDSVELEVVAQPAGLQLTVTESRNESTTHRFQTAESLLEFQIEYCDRLASRGFRLQTVTERRSGRRRFRS